MPVYVSRPDFYLLCKTLINPSGEMSCASKYILSTRICYSTFCSILFFSTCDIIFNLQYREHVILLIQRNLLLLCRVK
ncbi:hypothetical protein RchiOBHm_Chr6g0281721 [Rosa chinensis]|uniref:Uncharacterized protein n=1 Tax=Rosa chinensis TaxID=74649 RepID=A0A2P6PTL1_ROSCH|nr:hypothetical protein RchiOBHm_Chr6g0281721 [Rosa chinensis]